MRRLFTGLLVAALTAIVPITAIASDRDLQRAVADNLKASGKLDDYSIGVKCVRGTAWLRGRVSSQQQVGMALRLAIQTPGVEKVVNELKIERTREVANAVASEMPDAGAAPMSQPSSVMQATFSKFSTSEAESPTPAAPTGLETLQAAEEAAPEQSAPVPVKSIKTTKANQPLPVARTQPARSSRRVPVRQVAAETEVGPAPQRAPAAQGAPIPMTRGAVGGVAPARYDQPCMPNYSWPSQAAYPNYAAVTYPRQYSPTAWPYIGPFYPYPQVPLGWRKVTLEWDDGWWWLDFKNCPTR
ncbi:MAG: BON domain-containing protein [Pirellulales bacterium]